MFSQQAPNMEAALIQAGMPIEQATIIGQALGNCAQALEHRGPITIDTRSQPGLGSGNRGAPGAPGSNGGLGTNGTNGVGTNGINGAPGLTILGGGISVNGGTQTTIQQTINNVKQSFGASTLLGTVNGGTINAGATGAISLRDDRGVFVGLLNGVRALCTLVRGQLVQLFVDANRAEWFAVPLGVPLIAKATAAIAYQASGKAKVVSSDKTDPPTGATPITVYAFDRAIANGEYGLVYWDYYKSVLYFEPLSSEIAEDIDFHLSATLATGDATATMTVDSYNNGVQPTGTVTVNNWGFASTNGTEGWATLLSYDATTGNATYKIRQMKHTVQTVETDWQDDTTNHLFQKKTRDILVIPNAAETAFVTTTGGTQDPCS